MQPYLAAQSRVRIAGAVRIPFVNRIKTRSTALSKNPGPQRTMAISEPGRLFTGGLQCSRATFDTYVGPALKTTITIRISTWVTQSASKPAIAL
jgi:hypothetical protein